MKTRMPLICNDFQVVHFAEFQHLFRRCNFFDAVKDSLLGFGGGCQSADLLKEDGHSDRFSVQNNSMQFSIMS